MSGTLTKGDVFYVLDRHGVPRPIVYMHHHNGRDVFFSKQRFRTPTGGPSVPAGFIDEGRISACVRADASSMSGDELRVRQLAADCRDSGLNDVADELLEALDGDADDVEAAEEFARSALDALEDAEGTS